MMDNKFTYNYYRDLLTTLKTNNYNFIFFEEINKYQNSKYILLRHDVDFDIDKSIKIANIENEFGVKSTYFFLLNSDFYNIHHINNTKKILSILSMGNRISIHFDIGNYPNSDNKILLKHISKEISFFKDLFDVDINIISFHRPDKNVLTEKINLNIDHTYMSKYSKLIKYLSDSMKQMPEGDFIEIISLKAYNQIQLLIHPIWWNDNVTSAQCDYKNFINNKINNIRYEISRNSSIFEKD